MKFKPTKGLTDIERASLDVELAERFYNNFKDSKGATNKAKIDALGDIIEKQRILINILESNR